MSVDVSIAQAQSGTLPELLPLDATYEARHEFAIRPELCNWLIPGRLLLGRYPYCEPSRCKSRDEGEVQLKELVQDAGVTAFICLQDELPPQDDMTIGGKGGFLPYKATAQLMAAGISGPPPLQSLHELRTPDLDKFLPPKRQRRQADEDGATGQRREVEFLYNPIVDLGLPTEEQALEVVELLESQLRDPTKVVYLHCWGGRGRAGTIGCCFLGRAYGLGPAEAMERVQRAFDTRRDEGRPSPETDAQVQFVKDWIAKYGSK